MPGAVDWNPNKVKAPTEYAKRRGDNWHAGPKAVENGWAKQEGEFISEDNRAVSFYKYRQTINQRKNIMREYEGEGLGQGPEAEEKAKEIQENVNQQMQEADTSDERREVWRSQMGYNKAAA